MAAEDETPNPEADAAPVGRETCWLVRGFGRLGRKLNGSGKLGRKLAELYELSENDDLGN